MAAQAKRGKREAILDAMLEVVVERGFHEAPMALIAERSGASAGVIYHYFPSKDAIIEALYERVRGLKVAVLLEGFSADAEAGEVFVAGWLRLYAFHRKHQREMRFMEQYEHAGFTCRKETGKASEAEAAFERRFASRAKGGVLADWPKGVLEAMALGMVARLAREPRVLPVAVQREIAERMWEAIRAR